MKLMQFDYENEHRIYFKGVHSVIFDKEKGWSCTCEHSSIWGVNKRDKEKCNHILCCQMILNDRLEQVGKLRGGAVGAVPSL